MRLTSLVPQEPADAVTEPEPPSAPLTSSSLLSTSTPAPAAAVEPSSDAPSSTPISTPTLQPTSTRVPVESPPPPPPPPSLSPEPVPPRPVVADVPAPVPPAVIEELPLTEAAPAPEFLSFNEWRERYVVQPDPSAARRGKKRPRQDGAAGASAGAERDEAPRAANVSGAARVPLEVVDAGGAGGLGLDGALPRGEGQLVFENGALGLPPTTSSTLSPIQPLPNVGTGEPSDPLVHLKDRANYAGAECAAKLHRSSRQSKGASSILTEKKDRYMLTPCAATPKFVDVELCDEVQIDALVLANFEFFSSTFKHFKASCSVDYPGKPDDWHDLGTFRARNVRGVQVFRPLSNPPFCRYVRIDFLSHFGSEYYCPVSLLRVYGYTQLESFRESERKAKALEDALAAAELGEGEGEGDEEGGEEVERALEGALEVEANKLERVEEREVVETTAVETMEPVATSSEAPIVTSTRVEADPVSPTPTPSPSSPPPSSSLSSSSSSHDDETHTTLSDAPPASLEAVHTSSAAPAPSTSTAHEGSSAPDTPSATSAPSIAHVEGSSGAAEPSAHAPSSSEPIAATSSASPADSSRAPSPSPPTSSTSTSSTSTVVSLPSTAATHTATGRPATGSDHPLASPRPPPSPSSSPASRNDTPSSSASAPHHSASAAHVPRAPLPIPPPPPPPPAVAQPQPGESIYGTIMKRLASLEHNQTLAMGFIEAQSGMLREAFGRVERRLGDVEGSRSRQEQSLRQSLLELEKQRVDLERERLALASQISLLAQEIRFEKHLTLAQLVGLLLVVIFVGFTRGIPTSPFLHLASSTSTARASKRKAAEALGVTASAREKDWEEQRGHDTEGDKAAPATSEAPRRTHRISPSASLSRHSSAKRYPSISKPGALRRHYGPMTGSSSSSSKAMSRSWTPPVRHSSAPPEDVLDPSGNLVDTTRRRLVPRATGSGLGASRAYEFPLRSPGGSGTTSPARGATAQPPPVLALPLHTPSSHLTPQALESLRTRDLTPSSADEADGEQGGPRALTPPAGLGRPFPLETIPSFDGYSTYSSEDEAVPRAPYRRVAPPVPAVPSPSSDRQEKGKGRAPAPSPSSSSAASGSSPSARPPKPHVPPRPATALGIRLSSPDDVGRAAQLEDDELRGFAVQIPRSTLPSPPPEPVPLPRPASGTQGGKDE
ncbi:hypothetical protein JCM8208_000755 [Rhodotorula glutinis]